MPLRDTGHHQKKKSPPVHFRQAIPGILQRQKVDGNGSGQAGDGWGQWTITVDNVGWIDGHGHEGHVITRLSDTGVNIIG